VFEAIDGLDAWTIFMRQPGRFKLLLADVVMPRISGTELAARVRGVRPELPVLLMTGYSTKELLVRGIEAAPGEVVTKPFDADTLIAAVRKAQGATGPEP
jgi:DNA-binding response OmpR family regulator